MQAWWCHYSKKLCSSGFYPKRGLYEELLYLTLWGLKNLNVNSNSWFPVKSSTVCLEHLAKPAVRGMRSFFRASEELASGGTVLPVLAWWCSHLLWCVRSGILVKTPGEGQFPAYGKRFFKNHIEYQVRRANCSGIGFQCLKTKKNTNIRIENFLLFEKSVKKATRWHRTHTHTHHACIPRRVRQRVYQCTPHSFAGMFF